MEIQLFLFLFGSVYINFLFFSVSNKTQQTKEWKIGERKKKFVHGKITTSNEYAIYFAHKFVLAYFCFFFFLLFIEHEQKCITHKRVDNFVCVIIIRIRYLFNNDCWFNAIFFLFILFDGVGACPPFALFLM